MTVPKIWKFTSFLVDKMESLEKFLRFTSRSASSLTSSITSVSSPAQDRGGSPVFWNFLKTRFSKPQQLCTQAILKRKNRLRNNNFRSVKKLHTHKKIVDCKSTFFAQRQLHRDRVTSLLILNTTVRPPSHQKEKSLQFWKSFRSSAHLLNQHTSAPHTPNNGYRMPIRFHGRPSIELKNSPCENILNFAKKSKNRIKMGF